MLLSKQSKYFSLLSLFKKEPLVYFRDAQRICSTCSGTLKVRKSRRKKVYTFHLGGFISNETITECQNHNCPDSRQYGSNELGALVPFRCKFGYDVIVYIGYAMFLRHRQGEEIIQEVADKNVAVSLNEVYYLAKKFIVYLAALHNMCNDRICEIIHENGGYILHLDAFGDKGSQRIITGLDSISDIVLDNEKIVSEKSDYIKPFLERIKKQFGDPLAVVQDMGKGIMKAVESVFLQVKILVCHFHFLRDIGKDLLEKDYDVIRKRLRHFGILSALREFAKPLKDIIDADTEIFQQIFSSLEQAKTIDKANNMMSITSVYMLIIWIIEGKNLGNGYGFPFDRPHLDFTTRLNIAYEKIQKFKQTKQDANMPAFKTILKLERSLKEIIDDTELQNAAKRMYEDINVFDRLRNAMRIAPVESSKGLNDSGSNEDIKTIEEKVRKYRKWITKSKSYTANKKYKSFVAQIDKYWDKLFADAIEVTTKDGKIIIQPQRTNNILEQLFRDFNQRHMRKTGCAPKEKTLKAMVTNTPLIRNLKNEKYMKAVLGNNKTLESAFAEIDSAAIRDKMEETKLYPNKIPRKLKRILSFEDLPDRLLKLMATAA